MQTSGDVAGILTDLITMNGGIPTGAPTSQLIAYYAYEKMFREIACMAENFGCVFSLYVDDMTFSSKRPFDPKKLANHVDIVLRRYGHKPKYKKVKYYSKDKIKIVTGVGVTPTHALVVPNKRMRTIIENYRKVDCVTEFDPERIESLRGQINAAHQIDRTIFLDITRGVARIAQKQEWHQGDGRATQ
jgi:hypothetical protein